MKEGLLWVMILLSPFQDTILQKTPLKLPAASLSFLPLLALFLMAGMQRLWNRPFDVGRPALLIAAYVAVVCAVNLVGVEQGDVVVYRQSVVAYLLLSSLILFTIFGVDYRNSRGLRIAVYLSFGITILGIVTGAILGPNAISFLQVTPSLTGRPSGFSTEASTLSVQIVVSGMLTAHFLSRSWQKWCVGVLTCGLLIFSSSKGGFISLLLCVVVLGVAKSRSSLLSKIMVSAVLIPVLYVGSLLVLAQFTAVIDANETSTIGTRLSMQAYAVIAVAHRPFGVGFTGFLPSIPRYLPPAMEFVQSLFPFPIFFGEVKQYLYPPQTDADCKSFFFNFAVFFGIPFVFVFFRFMCGLLRRLFRYERYWLFVGVLFSTMAMILYYSTLNAWTLPILIGISFYEIKRIEDPVRMS
jgi:hypothetical protein